MLFGIESLRLRKQSSDVGKRNGEGRKVGVTDVMGPGTYACPFECEQKQLCGTSLKRCVGARWWPMVSHSSMPGIAAVALGSSHVLGAQQKEFPAGRTSPLQSDTLFAVVLLGSFGFLDTAFSRYVRFLLLTIDVCYI